MGPAGGKTHLTENIPLFGGFDVGRDAVVLGLPLGAKRGCTKQKLLLSMSR